ncbi:hypothetical protein RR48_01278 [Papilio machaon]|uniref:Uncharacterized protein n=1 Tax=Papilio machaon TaxID=76193 RepID=A0A0N1I5V0_PAPMA|nr:hypothetical protein RR48_01278 [Papilio machaon]
MAWQDQFMTSSQQLTWTGPSNPVYGLRPVSGSQDQLSVRLYLC